MMIKISVCIPSYNNEKTIAETIKSVLVQGEVVGELLVVDDCSSDRTVEIANALAGKDKRIIVSKNTENLGIVGNWNRCIEFSRNEYIALLHGDDRYVEGIIQKQLDVFSANARLAIVFTLANFIDACGNPIGHTCLPSEIRATMQECNLDDVLLALMKNHNSFITCDSALVKKSEILHAGGFRETFKQVMDLDMWLRVMVKSPVAFLDERLIDYRKSSSQATFRYHSSRTEKDDFIELLEEWIPLRFKNYPADSLKPAFESFERFIEEDIENRFCNSIIKGDLKKAISIIGHRSIKKILFKPGILTRVIKGRVKKSIIRLIGNKSLWVTPDV